MYPAYWSGKVLIKFVLWAGLAVFWATALHAAVPGDKRTILTSGDKVYTIYYQLGQSTVLFFGLKPETVICGNKNYFNIEKIKDGLTVQPLANFSTNLSVMSQGRRYLFFLTPSGSVRPDGFVDVKWIPKNQARPVRAFATEATKSVEEINKKLKIAMDFELTVIREQKFENGKRRVLELEIRNSGAKPIPTNALEVVASVDGKPLARQVLVWEDEELKSKKNLRGKLIISDGEGKPLAIAIGYQGKSIKFNFKAGRR